MKSYISTLFFLFFAAVISAQEQTTEIPLQFDTSGYAEENNSSFDNKLLVDPLAPSINAEMNVNEAGALTYMMPIETLKGLNSFQPNFSLTYNSQSGNGQAGWGWNITGLSTINQGGKSKEIDGLTIGPQFDGNDPFYLDGQRLIKNSDTEYVTEKYSKIKITKASSGEFSFTVQYTDGKIAKYKEVAPGQHYISVFIDQLDNYIFYTYENSGNTPRLLKVSYGGNTVASCKFFIDFQYKIRATPAKVYRNNIQYFSNKILDEVRTSSSYGGLYRKYNFTYDLIAGNTTERLRKIEISNELGEKLKPVLFDYNLGIKNGTIEKKAATNAGLPSDAEILGDIVAGDFFGDGKISTCYLAKKLDGTYVLMNSKIGIINLNGLPQYYLSRANLYAGKILKNNVVTERDQIIVDYSGYYEVKDLLTGDLKTLGNNSGTGIGPIDIHIDLGNGIFLGNNLGGKPITGDFNNDGLIDLLNLTPNFMSYDSASIIELGKGEITPKSINSNYLSLATGQTFPIEFDGDGIPELLRIDNGKYSILKFNYQTKEITQVPGQADLPLNDFYYEIAYAKRKTPLIFGDFNGDGLTDFLTPKNVYYIDKDNPAWFVVTRMETEQLLWWQYLGTGKGFEVSQKDFTSQKLAYLMPSQKDVIKHSSFWDAFWSGDKPTYEYTEYGATTIIATDFDHDGKTDLMSFSKFGKAKFNENKKLNDVQIQNLDVYYLPGFSNTKSLYTNKIYFYQNKTDAQGNINFSKLSTVLPVNDDLISPLSIPLMSTDFNQLNVYKSTLTISDPITKRDLSFTINNDNFTEGLIKKVDNGSGVDQIVEYMPMVENANGKTERCYVTASNDWQYPYYVHRNNGSFYLVNKIHTQFDGNILTTEYRFENAIQKLDGKGFLGFQKNYSSDPYESVMSNGKYVVRDPMKGIFWTIQTKNPLFDNLVTATEYGGLKKPFTRKTNILQKFDKGNHQYLILTTREVSTDYLKKINTSKDYTYDSGNDLKLLSVYTTYDNSGSSLSKFQYTPEFFNGSHYFYGKFDSVENTTYKDGLSFTTREENTYYPNGLISESKKFGNDPGAAAIITTSVYYPDTSGNLKEQTTSTIGIASQTTKYEYDPTGRYISKVTTPDGLSSLYTVDYRGRISDETSSLGLPTTYTFDNWGNIKTITDYLGKITTISKTEAFGVNGGAYSLSKKREGGVESIVTFDKFDREIQSKTQSINGKWLIVNTIYDIYGRKTQYSEPFFEGETPKWNTIDYDELNRPVKNTSFNQKVIKTCYEGLKVTTDDGYRKMSKTFDAIGNAVRLEDHGGIIGYSYFPNGALKETNYDGIKTTFEIDGWGNKTKITDPSAGIFTYEYDNLSRLTYESNPKGHTSYAYDDLGRVKSEKTYGISSNENTTIEKTYVYNNNTKLPEKITGTNNSKAFTYTTLYDQYFRIRGKIEETPDFKYTSSTTYDGFGRADVVTMSTVLSNPVYTSTSSIKNVYDSNGILVQQNDAATNSLIWHVSDADAKGQTLQMEYGNGYVLKNSYNTDDEALNNIKHQNSSKGITAIDINYDYDVNKGVLNGRNNLVFNKDEKFEYDIQNRLLSEKVNNLLVNEYTYDKRGRMTSNSELGKYNYGSNDYKLQNISFNTNGQNVNTERGFADIKYNAFKSPLQIALQGKDNLNFEYNTLKTRYKMTSSVTGVTKLYSSDFVIEITKDGSKTQIITFITGDPYSANYIKKEVLFGSNVSESGNYYLHRDNIGSILAITRTDGTVAERRYFDAWGNLKAMTNAQGQLVTSNPKLLFMDRGYTGHEHLQTVGLVNMNARIYDPILRRFLSADNEISDPFNTQAYDRYSYVLNNPLLYIDQSGNNPFLILAIFMAACDIFIHVMDNVMSNTPFWHGLGRVIVVDGLSSAISFGIGSAVKSIASFALKALVQAGMHAVSGGLMSELNGGKFISGFASGAISSLVSSGIEALGTNFAGAGSFRTADGGYSLNSFGKSDIFKAVMITSGGLAGGLSSVIAGGDFFQGFKQGVITSGLNHLGHLGYESIQQQREQNFYDKQLKEMYNQLKKDVAEHPTPADFYASIGGPLGDWAAKEPQSFGNTCAARLSKALNYSGFEIPKGTANTYQGKDGKYYFINAQKMNEYLSKNSVWGTPTEISSRSVKNAVIYQTGFGGGVSGHLDIVYRGRAAHSIYHYNTLTTYFWH